MTDKRMKLLYGLALKTALQDRSELATSSWAYTLIEVLDALIEEQAKLRRVEESEDPNDSLASWISLRRRELDI